MASTDALDGQPTDLPGGAVAVLKAARQGGGWWCWHRRAEGRWPVKVTTKKDSPTGEAAYEDRPVVSLLVKGRAAGVGFVAQYLDGKVETAYLVRGGVRERVSLPVLKKVLKRELPPDDVPPWPWSERVDRPPSSKVGQE